MINIVALPSTPTVVTNSSDSQNSFNATAELEKALKNATSSSSKQTPIVKPKQNYTGMPLTASIYTITNSGQMIIKFN